MKAPSELATIIDANNLILGRMATVVAKRLLQGEHIMIINAETAIISGKKLSQVKKAKKKLEIGHPRKGPYFPRRPDRYVKRAIRGMLPRKKPKGKDAYKRLRVFIGTPQKYKDYPVETITAANSDKLKCSYLTVGELTREIGWIPAGE
jgi:large subunit ribosomal protein L13